MGNILTIEEFRRADTRKKSESFFKSNPLEQKVHNVEKVLESLGIKKDRPSFLGDNFFVIDYLYLVRKKNIKVLTDHDDSVASNFGLNRIDCSFLNREKNTIYLPDYMNACKFSDNDMYMERQLCQALYYYICDMSPLDCICACELKEVELNTMYNSFYTKKNVR